MAAYFPRIHTALAEWLACMAFILPLTLREVRPRRLLLAGGVLITLLVTFGIMEKQRVQGVIWVLLMALAMLQMFLMICLYRWPNRAAVVYSWAHAFLIAELAASVEWNINYYLIKSSVITSMEQTYFCMSAVYLLIFGGIYWRRKGKRNDGLWELPCTKREAFGAAAIAIGAFMISNIQFAFQDTMFSESLGDGVLYARTLVDIAGVIMLYANTEQRREVALRYELGAMANILQRQYEQYEQFEANNEAMHRVYHDLKHQIAYLESEPDLSKRMDSLKEMKEIIRKHESKVSTGNKVLDVLLTSKSLICADEGIVFTCYADAQSLGFMDAMDVCSIFGNTIDNAIEYERKVQNPDDRLIRIYVDTRSEFLLIRIQNFCDVPVDFVNGTLVTTKADKQLHGYGLKSVRLSAEKYNGYLDLEQENGWFTVTVLIPLPKQA